MKFPELKPRIVSKYLVILFILSLTPLRASETCIIYSLDISKSMKRHNRFSFLQQEVIAHIIKNVKIGDRLIITAFGNDVYVEFDKKIGGTTDIEKALYIVKNLKPSDDWTYIAKAVDSIYSIMENTNRQNNKTKAFAYLVTDGINEPPPWTKESPLTLSEILQAHELAVKNKNNFIYILTLGIEPGEFVKSLKEEIKRRGGNSEVVKSEIPKLPSPKELDKVKLTFNIPSEITAGKDVKLPIEWDIKIHKSIPPIKVDLNINPNVKFAPQSFYITKDMKEHKKIITFKNIPPGSYVLIINPQKIKGFNIEPTLYKAKFKAVQRIVPLKVELQLVKHRLFAGKNRNITIKGKISSKAEVNDSVIIIPSASNLEIKPGRVTIVLRGKQAKFKKKFILSKITPGVYSLSFRVITPPKYTLDKSLFEFDLYVKKLNILPYLIIGLIILLIFATMIYCINVPKFPSKLELAVKEKDIIVKREKLRKLQKKCSNKISAETIARYLDIVPDFKELRCNKNGEIFKLYIDDEGNLKEEPIIFEGDEIEITAGLFIIFESFE